MAAAVLAALAGIVWVQQWQRLPQGWEWPALTALLLLCTCRRQIGLAALLAGALWAAGFGAWRLAQQLPEELQNQAVDVEGYIAGMPKHMDNRIGFDFAVTRPAGDFPSKLRLNWYRTTADVAAGQSWRLTVKLRQPHGRLNPGGFDYEAWLFANRIGATGYVRDEPAPSRLADDGRVGAVLARARQSISARLDQALPGGSNLGLIKALTIGSQDGISQAQWQVFRKTGTVHLIVISGSHISLVAGLVFLFVRRAWAWTGNPRWSPQRVAALTAWLAAAFYAGLAGYSVPTLRAVVMLAVAFAALSWQRHVGAWRILLLALLAVLIVDPLAVQAVGFWLSFAAVGLLIYVSAGRLGRPGYWREAALAQWATAAGLAPLLILFFQQVSLISPLANWLAVPAIGIVVVPLALAAVALLFVWPMFAQFLLQLADWILQSLWWTLQALAELPLSNATLPEPAWPALLAAGIGSVLLLAPRGFPGRYLGVWLLLPVLVADVARPPPGEARLALLDVGQGLAAVVETAEHRLLFDTGARYSEDSDMGDSVILPYLRSRGIRRLDGLIVSHDDIDHSGGAESVLAEVAADQVFSSVPAWAERPEGRYCRAGQTWNWDGVEFRMLAPSDPRQPGDNDNSCVLQVRTASASLLLTADIEQAGERRLVELYGDQLASTFLVAPHHGSKTSSTLTFLEQVAPAWVLIPAGYSNRFGFPHPQVLERYRRMGANWANTAEQGAIIVDTAEMPVAIHGERCRHRRYWMADDACPAAEAGR